MSCWCRWRCEAGAELVAGAEIVQASSTDAEVDVVARDGRHFKAPIVIAADGVHSVVARRLGINSGWPASSIALDMMEETSREVLRDRDPSTLWVAYGHDPSSNGRGAASHGGPRRAPEGYAYMFPKRDHVNVGIGYVLAHYRDSIGTAPYELQRGLVDHLRARAVIEGESVRRNFTPAFIPVAGPLRRPGRGRVLLAGDAGGFVNAVHRGRNLLRDGVRRAGGEICNRNTSRLRVHPRAALPTGVRSRNRRGAARFGVDPALPVRGPAQNREGDRGCASCICRDAPRRGLRQRTDPLSASCVAGSCCRRPAWRDSCSGSGSEQHCGRRERQRAHQMAFVLDRQFEHLLRRAGFGARPDELGLYRVLSIGGAVDTLVNYERDRGRRRFEDRAARLRPHDDAAARSRRARTSSTPGSGGCSGCSTATGRSRRR